MDVEEDPTCRFIDYTNETDWERFIAAIEETLLRWGLGDKGAAVEGPKAQLLTLQQRTYLLLLHHADAPAPAWTDATRHFTPTLLSIANAKLDAGERGSMERFFGVESYLVLHQYHTAFGVPESTDDLAAISMDATINVLDHDAKTLLSSLMVALSNCNCTIPAFVRLGGDNHFIGAAMPGATGSIALQFETACVPEVPPAQQRLQGLIDFFQTKLQLLPQFDDVVLGTGSNDLRHGLTAAVGYDYAWHARAHALLSDDSTPSAWRASIDADVQKNLPFQTVAWGPQKAPLQHLKLHVRWPALREGMFVDNAVHTTLEPTAAPEWSLSVQWEYDQATLPLSTSLRQLVQAYQQLRPVDRAVLVSEVASTSALDNPLVTRYQESVPAARAAVAIGAAIGSWVSSTASLDAVQASVADLFVTGPKESAKAASQWCQVPKVQHGVVVGQLMSRLAQLISSQHGINIKCAMWVEFVRLLRETWKAQVLLPWMGIGKDGLMNPADMNPLDGISMPVPDFHLNLLHQKLQLLNLCIARRVRSPISRRHSRGLSAVSDDASDDEFFDSLEESPALGVLRRLDSVARLGDANVCINVPKTQDPAPLTEDIAKQHQDILAKLGVSAESTLLRQQIQSSSMLSDMQAFKAANPGSCLADFIRWYSPRDWLPREPQDTSDASVDGVSSFSQGHLSARMHEANPAAPTNPWHRAWAQATPLPAEKQRPLFDAVVEAEKIFDYLDTMAPRDLFHHLLVAVLSNVSVLWTGVAALPCVAEAIAGLQEACAKAIAALDDDAHEADGKPATDEERLVHMAIADDACEKAVVAAQRVEVLAASAASAAHTLPGASRELLNDLVVRGVAVSVTSADDRAIVGSVVWPTPTPTPDRREYVLHCVAPRPFLAPDDGHAKGAHPVVVSRMFALFQDHSVRFATALADTEF
ncbi:Rab3 GTPase-activating protein catalytic subunit [Achlya hypogyna]|uniref:Rab3 GTPase-activating protein catalytic subunit n=1 Tax=Achlya hypogyna TaxID=1202772 RepID=A0A1V9Y690_ACHHY|nr:Rab3 GTPase-activating protein catalytic subunit [Achlya hypogyna]